MNVINLLEKYFKNKVALEIILEHGQMVAAKALGIAGYIGDEKIDRQFIEEASLLHDIGACRTASPGICCFGTEPYILHGIIGREILDSEGFPAHALVCERHIGVGITIEDIRIQRLPLPERNMSPVSIEERIICFADLFYSKKPGTLTVEKSPDHVMKKLDRFGEEKRRIFEEWSKEFGLQFNAG
jgi:uncharacterized protein